MSFEAINRVSAAELEAKAMVAEAENKAKQLLAEADRAGRAAVEAAGAKAEAELQELRRQAADKAVKDNKQLQDELATKKAVLLAKAEGRLDQAAGIVVERIVNS